MDSWVGKIYWRRGRLPTSAFWGFPGGSAGKESVCNMGDLSLIPGLGRCPGEGKGYPLQNSRLNRGPCLCSHHDVDLRTYLIQRKNVLSWLPSTARMDSAFQPGFASVGGWGSSMPCPCVVPYVLGPKLISVLFTAL